MLPALERLPSDLISWEFARPAPWKKSSPIPPDSMGYSADSTPQPASSHCCDLQDTLPVNTASISILLH